MRGISSSLTEFYRMNKLDRSRHWTTPTAPPSAREGYLRTVRWPKEIGRSSFKSPYFTKYNLKKANIHHLTLHVIYLSNLCLYINLSQYVYTIYKSKSVLSFSTQFVFIKILLLLNLFVWYDFLKVGQGPFLYIFLSKMIALDEACAHISDWRWNNTYRMLPKHNFIP